VISVPVRKEQQRSLHIVRLAVLGLAVLLPTLSLVPLGGLWLWDRGWILYWALCVAVVVGLVYASQWRLLTDEPSEPETDDARQAESASMDPRWSPREEAAWRDVLKAAGQAQPDTLVSRDAILALGRETIEAVARRLHPEINDPFWHFTLPEAFALSEQVSRQMRKLVETSIPLGDRLTMRQILRVYRWRGALDVAEQAFDAWRVIRLVNPLTAATQEIRERLTKQLFLKGRDHIASRLARSYVEEVGRAAIDLYGGRLKVPLREIDFAGTTAPPAEPPPANQRLPADPLNMLILGPALPAKQMIGRAVASAVRTALVDEHGAGPSGETAAPLQLAIEVRDARSSNWFKPGSHKRTMAVATEADLIVWIGDAPSIQPDQARHSLQAIEKFFSTHARRRMPAVMAVITQSQNQPHEELARLIGAWGFTGTQIVLWPAAESAVPHGLADAIGTLLPPALRARRSRLDDVPPKRRPWATLFGQVAGAGRSAIGSSRKK
jgi:uncharacterized protein